MLLNLTKKIDKLCKYIENIVKYDQFGLYNMLCALMLSKARQRGRVMREFGSGGIMWVIRWCYNE